MGIQVSIVESEHAIQTKIVDALVKAINLRFRAALPQIETNIKKMIREGIEESDEYHSLEYGALSFELGMRPGEGQQKMEDLIDHWTNSLHTIYTAAKRVGNAIECGLLIQAIEPTYADVLMMDAARVQGDDGELPWLDWILTKGSSRPVMGYKIKYGNFPSPKPSRSGSALMIEEDGGSWGLPEPFNYGQIDDNFITRAIQKKKDEIIQVIINGLS